jgi:hypothetical protein
MFGNKKDRLYIAYYPNSLSAFQFPSTIQNELAFHVALLLVPKSPVDVKAKRAVRYHITKKDTAYGKDTTWSFERKAITCCSRSLVGLQFLGKLEPQVTRGDLDRILAKVTIIQGNPRWLCSHWVMNAIQVRSSPSKALFCSLCRSSFFFSSISNTIQ